MKYRLDFMSQNPSVVLQERDSQKNTTNFIRLGSEHMHIVNKSVEQTILTKTIAPNGSQPIDRATFNATLADLHVPALTEEDYKQLGKFFLIDTRSFSSNILTGG